MPRSQSSLTSIAALGVLVVAASCAPAPIAVPASAPSAPSASAESAAPSMNLAPTAVPVASATALATAAPVAAVVPRGLAAPRDIRPVGGIEFALLAGVADLHVESTIALSDASLIEAQVADDVRSVEREFGMPFAGPPEIYVFASTASYARGMATIFGYPRRTADWIAENSVAFFEPPLGIVGVNWEIVGSRRPVAAFRHELTHLLTLRACEPRCDLVPAWLNEGQGRIAEAYLPGADWRLMRVRYEAASMATTETLFPLTALVTQGAWNSLTGWAGYYKYQQAARVVELLREDVGGEAPIARIYERIRRGESVSRAYATLTGKAFSAFVAELPGRIREGADGAGIVTVATTPAGPGASYLLYGLRPNSTIEVTIAGERAQQTIHAEVSPYGAVFGSLLSGLPRGLYAITATDGRGVTLSALVVKSVTTGGPY